MAAASKDDIRRILSSIPTKHISDSTLVPAGVMLLLYPKNGEYCILLNKRTTQVEHHKGEISFPGGSREDQDETLLDTALRETHEEMGIPPNDVEVLGELDDMSTSSQFVIRPHVGTVPSPYLFKPNPVEVAAVLEVPMSALTNDDNIRDEVRLVDGQLVDSPTYAFEGHLIFGATARVLRRFLDLVAIPND